MSEIKFFEAMKTLKALMAECRVKIVSALEQKWPELEIKKSAGHGANTEANDRSMYYWIETWYKDKQYTLNLFLSEIDSVRGNCHSQLGRIMFVTDYVTQNTPNILGKHSERETELVFCSYKWHDPLDYIADPSDVKSRLQNGKWFMVDDVLYDDELCDKLADAFIRFVKEDQN